MKLALQNLPFVVVPYTRTEVKPVKVLLITASTPGAVSLGILTAAIHSGNAGTGYTAGDVVPILNTGGTDSVAATVNVLTVDGSGVPLTVSIANAGRYTVLPSNATSAVHTTGGTGTGLYVDLTWGVVFAAVSGGANALVAPTVTFGAGAATATAVLNGAGAVTSLTITAAGSYATAPTFTLTYAANTAVLFKTAPKLGQLELIKARWKASGSANNALYAEQTIAAKNVAGTVSLVGTYNSVYLRDVSSWAVVASTDGTNVFLTGNATTTETVEFDGAVDVSQMASNN